MPVGTPGGLIRNVDDVAPVHGMVRLGVEMFTIDESVYGVWTKAASAPERAEWISLAAEASDADPELVCESLISVGLLLELREDDPILPEDISVRLLGELVGNVGPDHFSYIVVGGDGTQVRIGPRVFDVLLRTDGVAPVSFACGLVDAAIAGGDMPGSIGALTGSLPLLVRTGMIRLDRTP